MTFALSLTLFELIIFEIAGLLESSSRYFYWRFVLTLILVMVIAVIPYKIALSCISNIRIGMFLDKTWINSDKFIRLIYFSANALGSTVNIHTVVCIHIFLLADWRPISINKCFSWNIYH